MSHNAKAWLSYVGKIPEDQDISDKRQKSVPDSPILNLAGNGKCAKNHGLKFLGQERVTNP